LLSQAMPPDVDLLKVEVPSDATPDTPWEVTRVSRLRYYIPVPPLRAAWDQPGPLGYALSTEFDQLPPDTDIAAIRRRRVAVSPLSLDLTSRTDLSALERLLRLDSVP